MEFRSKLMILCMIVISQFIPALVAADSSQDLMPVWNNRVNPATHPIARSRRVKPVDWETLGNKVPVACFRKVTRDPNIESGGHISIKNYQDYYDVWRALGFDVSNRFSEGWFTFAENNKELVDYWSENNISILSIIGPGSWSVDGWFSSGFGTVDGVPDEIHRYMLEKMGDKFGGWEYSEEDDRYNLVTAWCMPEEPVSRKKAYEYFMGFNRQHCKRLQDYVTVLDNTVWGVHYMADFESIRMLGAQMPNHMCNSQLWSSVLRGASRQNGILWWPGLNTWWGPRWGEKNYYYPEKELQMAGLSLSLLRRVTYLEYMYGACILQMPEPCGMDPYKKIKYKGKELSVPTINPQGQLQLEIADFVKKHPDIGVMHTPVALVWDFYTGWGIPRKYGKDWHPYCVWGSMPYEKGDHQISEFYNMIFPESRDAVYMFDEQGYLSHTPCGEIFDVLLSDTPRYVLNQYNAAVVLGPTKIEGQLQTTLQDFIDRGGSVATTAANLTKGSAKIFGVELTGERSQGEHYVQLLDNGRELNKAALRDINESKYTLHKLKVLKDTKVLAVNWYGEPVVVSRKTKAGGEMLLFAADYGLSNWVGPKELVAKGFNELQLSPYLMLEHFKIFIKPWLRKWNIIDIKGSGIQYVTNVTRKPNRFIVTLSNNQGDNWDGNIALKGACIDGSNNWITGKSLGSGKFVNVKIAPHDLAVIELIADRDVVKFKKEKDLPKPTTQELGSISEATLAKIDKYSPEQMLKASVPSLGRQNAEPAAAIYVNAWLFEGIDSSKWVPVVKELGLSGIELRGTDLYRPEMKKLWARLNEAGLHVGTVHVGVDLVPFNFGTIASDDDKFREPVLKWLEKTMDIMHQAGISRLVLYPGYRRDMSYESKLNHFGTHTISSLKRLAEYAEEKGIKIILEGHHHQLYRKLNEQLDILKKVNSDAIALGLDTGFAMQQHIAYDQDAKIVDYFKQPHMFLIPTDPTIGSAKDQKPALSPQKAFIRSLKTNRLEYVHLSNLKPYPNGVLQNTHTPLDQGIISNEVYQKILDVCRGSNISCCLYVLDPEDPIAALRDSVKVLNLKR